MNNHDLKNDIPKIIQMMNEIEDTWHGKMAVVKNKDMGLPYPHCIDVEDTAYFYPTEKERDEDFDALNVILTKYSENYKYF